jgi:hypothetical protein
MRKIFLAVGTATAILIGTVGASFAATPQAPAVTVRQDVTPDVVVIDIIPVRGLLTGDPNLSNDQDDGD